MKNKALLAFSIFLLCVASLFAACDIPKINILGEAKSYVVNFYVGEELVSTQTVKKASELSTPTVDLADGYYLDGWLNKVGGKLHDGFGLSPTTNLYASVKPTVYSISYMLDGGVNDGDNPSSYTVEDDILFKAPKKEDCVFLGWDVNENIYPDYSMARGTVGEVVLKAVWGKEGHYYLNVDNLLVSSQTSVFESVELPEKLGYEVKSYKVNGEPITFPYTAIEQLTKLEVEWKPIEYKVTFIDGGDSVEIPFTIESESFSLTAPSKTGCEFVGFDDGSGVTASYTVKNGTAKNIQITVKWRKLAYRLTFDNCFGNNVSSFDLYYNDEIAEISPKDRDNYDFLGWYTAPVGGELFDFENAKMPAHGVTLYAHWYSTSSWLLSYQAVDENDAPINASYGLLKGSFADGTELNVGESIELYAENAKEGYLFECWRLNGDIYSYDRFLSFVMTDVNLELKAVYKSINDYIFNKNEPQNVQLDLNGATLKRVVGNGVKSKDYSAYTGEIKKEYLSALSVGVYLFGIVTSNENAYFTVTVEDGENTIHNVDIDYDHSYPSVTLNFDGKAGEDYEYSLNGGDFIAAVSGGVVNGYDKAIDNTVVIRSKSNPGDKRVFTKKACSSSYLETTFTYGGRIYDYVVDDFEEYEALLSYLVYVYAPLNKVTDNSLGSDYVASCGIDFFIEEGFLADYTANRDGYASKFFAENCVPYSPAFSNGFLNGEANLKIYFNVDDINSVRSSQQTEIFEDKQGLVIRSQRRDGFEDFFIDSANETQLIRTLYELEELPFGVKPVFEDEDSDAYRVYQRAREILTYICDDTMSDYKKAACIYDYLGVNVTYDHVVAADGSLTSAKYRAFTTAGSLLDGVGVCDGIASAMRLMCIIEGIPCEEICGMGNGMGHAWNKAYIGGKWYGFDATWTRQNIGATKTVTHKYAFMSEFDLIETDHYENQGVNVSTESYVGILTDGEHSYYDLGEELWGESLIVDTSAELNALLDLARLRGATIIDFEYVGGPDISEFLLGCSLPNGTTYSHLGENTYAIFI